EPVRMRLGRLDGELVRVWVPTGRMNDGCVNASDIHLLEQVVGGEIRNLAMVRVGGDVVPPDMNLRINYRLRLSTSASCQPAASAWPRSCRAHARRSA